MEGSFDSFEPDEQTSFLEELSPTGKDPQQSRQFVPAPIAFTPGGEGAAPRVYPYNFHPYTWLPGETIELRPPAARHVKSLDALRLSIADYSAVMSFVGHPFDYCIRFNRVPDRTDPSDAQSSKWSSAPQGQALTHLQLIRHLQGNRWIATGCRWNPNVGPSGKHQTRSFAIDIDAGPDMLGRYAAVVRALGSPSLLFRSSGSGGLHAWYFLDAPVDRFRLKNKAGTGGAIVRLLGSEGLTEAKGQIEFYPNGKLKGGKRGNRLRVPFGAQSCLLDPLNPTIPVTGGTPLDDLRYVAAQFAAGVVPVHAFDTFFARAALVRTPRAARFARPRKRRRTRTTRIDAKSPTVLHTGLTGPNQLNSTLNKVAHHFRWSATGEEECTQLVLDWLDRNHNGHSATYNESREAAREEAVVIVRRVYLDYGMPGARRVLPVLTDTEIVRIVNASAGTLCYRNPASGAVRELKRYRLQEFLFTAHQLHKDWVLKDARRAYSVIASRYPALDPGGDTFAEEFEQQFRYMWPDPLTREFIVPFAYECRSGMKGMKGSGHTPYWTLAQATGLYTQTRPANYALQQCALYRVKLDFGTSAPRYDDLETWLSCNLTETEIRSAYSATYARQILATASGRPAVETRNGQHPSEELLVPRLALATG